MTNMLNLKINGYYAISTTSRFYNSPDRIARIVKVKSKTIHDSRTHSYFVSWPQRGSKIIPYGYHMWDIGIANKIDAYSSKVAINSCQEVTRADFVRQHRELTPEEIEAFERELINEIQKQR